MIRPHARPVLAAARRLCLILIAPLFLQACGKVVTQEEAEAAGSQAVAGNQAFRTIRDEVGRDVLVPAVIRKVAVTNSYNAELVIAVAGPGPIVGVDESTPGRVAYAGFSRDKVISPNLGALNYEKVAQIRPDVVLIPRNGLWQEAVRRLEPFGVPVLVVTGWDPKYWEFNVRLTGQLFDRPQRADEILTFTNGIRSLLAQRLAGVAPISVYYEDSSPNRSAGANSGKTAFIARAGGRHIFDDVTTNGGLNIQTDPARILRTNPQLIIKEASEDYRGLDPALLAQIGQTLVARPGWSDLDAVRSGRVIVYDAWPLNLAGWNIASLYVAKWAHPDRFADIDPQTYARRWASEFLGATYDGDARFIHAVPR